MRRSSILKCQNYTPLFRISLILVTNSIIVEWNFIVVFSLVMYYNYLIR